jgi:two-component sensor histidine kinase
MDHEGIELKTNIDVEYISINHGVPLGIIFNELITNSIKYGFQDSIENKIIIDVQRKEQVINVSYQDKDIGNADFKSASTKSLGFTLIESLLKQLDATCIYDTDQLFKLEFQFPQ